MGRVVPPQHRLTSTPYKLLLLCILLLGTSATLLFAQEEALKPWILVVPPENRTDNSALTPAGVTVAQTMELTLQLLGEYEVRFVDPDRIPEAVISGDLDALEEFAEERTLDYVVFGGIESADGAIELQASVWSRQEGVVTVTESTIAESMFDIFIATDTLTSEFLSAFSGQRIAFGEIRLIREGWNEGEYTVLVDGTPVGTTIRSAENVLIGNRFVEVIAENGPMAGSSIFSAPVFVDEGEAVTIRFSMTAPPEPVATPEPEPEPEPEPAVEEPEIADTAAEPDSGEAPAEPPAPAYQVGDTGPAGGVVFFDKGSSTEGWRYL